MGEMVNYWLGAKEEIERGQREDDEQRAATEPEKSFVLSNTFIEGVVEVLKFTRDAIKNFKKEEAKLTQQLYNHMNEHPELVSHKNGDVMLSWRYAKDSLYFDVEQFKLEHKSLYEKYLKARPGTRRLLIK